MRLRVLRRCRVRDPTSAVPPDQEHLDMVAWLDSTVWRGRSLGRTPSATDPARTEAAGQRAISGADDGVWFHDIVDTCLATSFTPRFKGWAVSLGRLVVAAVKVEGRAKAEVARDYGVSRQWVHELIRRFEAEGEVGLEPRCRRPRRSPHRTSVELEEEIVELRKALAEEGLDAGAHTIAFHLAEHHGVAPAVSTIWRILTLRGFVIPQPQKRPRSSFIRFEADQPNEGRRRGGQLPRSRCGPRVPGISAHRQRRGVHRCSPRRGRCAIEIELDALGIRFRHSTPNHPQTCGKVERFHQTEKRWLRKQPPAADLTELQVKLDWFRDYYNTCRPHRGIGRRTPAVVFDARPKASPSRPGLTVPSHCRVRRDRVDRNGRITLRYNSRMHHIGLGRRHAGVRVLALVADLDVRVLTEDG